MKAAAWVFALVCLIGIIHYDWGRLVLATVLISGAVFFGSAALVGIMEVARRHLRPNSAQKPTLPDALSQAHALADRSTVKDDELARLRKMAGL